MTGDKNVEKDNADRKEWKTMNLFQKYHYLVDNITVELILVFYVFPIVLSGTAIRNLNLEKACRVNLQYNVSVCDALAARKVANLSDEDDRVHVLVAQMAIWKNPLQSALPALLILFLGSWSDRRARRKPCLVLPIIGQFLTSLGLIACRYFYYEWPLEVAGVIEAVFPSITGGGMTIIMAAFSYIADISTEDMRTFRIGVVNMVLFLSAPIGNALGGVLLQPIGYYGIFSLIAGMYALGFLYGIFRIKEAKKPVPRPENISFLRDFFDLRHIVETISVVFKKREGTKRLRIILLILLSMALAGPNIGESEIQYSYLRKQFVWSEKEFGYYAAYSIIVGFFGTLIGVGVLSRRLEMNDALLGLISCVSKIFGGIVYAFSTQPWMLYVGNLADILSGLGAISMRSLASKQVPPNEFGKVNSLFELCVALTPFIYSPIFSVMYSYTISSMAGSFYLLGALLTILPIIIFIWLYILHKETAEEEAHTLETFKYTNSNRIDQTGSCTNEGFQNHHLEQKQNEKITEKGIEE